jgi:hypothetical protein
VQGLCVFGFMYPTLWGVARLGMIALASPLETIDTNPCFGRTFILGIVRSPHSPQARLSR